MEIFRKAGYHQYARWLHGKLGRANRHAIPARVVCRIRTQYPVQDGRYTAISIEVVRSTQAYAARPKGSVGSCKSVLVTPLSEVGPEL